MSATPPLNPPCRVCGAEPTRFLCTTPNEHSKQDRLHHYRCLTCDSVYVGNTIDNEELGQAYSTLNKEVYYREIDIENRKKMEVAAGFLAKSLPLTAKVLDVGTGNGFFVHQLRAAGFTSVAAHEIPGADLSGIREIASAIYQDDDYSSLPSDHFDAVTLLDVVEHVPDPQFLMQVCARVLKPGGMIYFHTPVVTRTDRLMHFIQRLPVLGRVGSSWQRGRTSVFHLQNYTEHSLSLILERAGFDDTRVEVRNELSWPVSRYVRIYVVQKQSLPGFITPLLTPVLYPILATNFFNANKSIVSARKRAAEPQSGGARA
jgi:2-polyprenyl-3-methyl-5-hydroxy-6-metoxy-1,4-benzoquinol methylase